MCKDSVCGGALSPTPSGTEGFIRKRSVSTPGLHQESSFSLQARHSHSHTHTPIQLRADFVPGGGHGAQENLITSHRRVTEGCQLPGCGSKIQYPPSAGLAEGRLAKLNPFRTRLGAQAHHRRSKCPKDVQMSRMRTAKC